MLREKLTVASIASTFTQMIADLKIVEHRETCQAQSDLEESNRLLHESHKHSNEADAARALATNLHALLGTSSKE